MKIIRDKCAYLLNELLHDVESLSEENGLAESVISNTASLKRTIVEAHGGDFKHLIKMLHKLNHAISYSKIRKQNKVWLATVTNRKSMFSNMRRGVVRHSTMDNNDGRQESVTGSGTTHDTNQTIFQLPTEHERENFPQMEEEDESPLDIGMLTMIVWQQWMFHISI